MTDLHFATLTDAAEALRRRETSSVELTRSAFERIKRLDGDINAFLTLTEERAMEEAGKADELLARGEAGPLTGIPAAIKDVICTGVEQQQARKSWNVRRTLRRGQ
jgi:aspartyl-tRNA(Asn)/glutamyl-tRNA(Gln) amidotransferase subunit A